MKHQHAQTSHQQHYGHLLLMLGLSAAAMFVLMYAMVDQPGNVYVNVNQLYMALLMVAPMAIIELVVMRSMYPNRLLNRAIMAASATVLLGSWLLIRQQAAVGDAQFLRSMIPHHGGAILMCEQSAIDAPEVQALCRAIIQSQQSEIAQMKALLGESAAQAAR
jgi:hypothetical protein